MEDRTWGHWSGHVLVLFDRPYLRDTYLPSLAHTYFSGSETLDYN